MTEQPHPRWSDDIIEAFTAPATAAFVNVPNTITTSASYISMMQSNLRAEYSLFFQEAAKVAARRDAPWQDAEIQRLNQRTARLWLSEPELTWYLVSVKLGTGSQSIMCVIAPSPATEREYDDEAHAYKLKTRHDLEAVFSCNDPQSCKVCVHGYIGSNMQQHEAWDDLDPSTPILRCIRNPTEFAPGHFAPADETTALVTTTTPLNMCQQQAIALLERSVELIHGPPGTGKSTTIFHLIRSRLPAGAKVVVTCSRNGAVDSITQKLRALEVPDAYYIQVVLCFLPWSMSTVNCHLVNPCELFGD